MIKQTQIYRYIH